MATKRLKRMRKVTVRTKVRYQNIYQNLEHLLLDETIQTPREVRAKIYFTDDLYQDALVRLRRQNGSKTFEEEINNRLGKYCCLVFMSQNRNISQLRCSVG